MNSSKVWSRNTLWLTAAGAFLISSGCSVLYNFSTTQCDKDGDESCTSKGPQFAYATCKNHVCVQKIAATGGSPSTSTGGHSGTTGGDTAQGGQATGGDANTGGAPPGTGGAPACVNAKCWDDNATSGPHTCINDVCVALTTPACPVLIPQSSADQRYNAPALLRSTSPIIIGGFASMTNLNDLHDTYAIVNWDLAFSEFNQSTLGGLPSYDGTGLRPLVGLICDGNNGTTDTVNTAMTHLANDIHVPGILSTLSSDNLLAAFSYSTSPSYTGAGGKPVFFMSTGSASLTLTTLNDNSLVWHMLGNPRLLAATTAGLIQRIEPIVNQARKDYAQANPGGPDDPSIPNSLRVTIVYSSNSTMVDIQNVLINPDTDHPETLLTFNGASAISQAANGNFHTVQVTSGSADVTAALTELQNNPPHIIIAMATSEFPKSVMPQLENLIWPSNRMRPYYVMSHLIYLSTDLQTRLTYQNTSVSPHIEARLLGVNYAQTQDAYTKVLYDSYLLRLGNSYPPQGDLAGSLGGTENMYDGAYYLLYSVAAAAVNRKASNPFSGTNILSGLMDRVISPGVASVDIGPTNIGTVVQKFNQLGTSYAMSLWGVEGKPTFDTTTGTRNSATSVWCIQYDSNATPPGWVYQADGLLYDPDPAHSVNGLGVFTIPASGVPACLQNY